jgi:hypothetical protein
LSVTKNPTSPAAVSPTTLRRNAFASRTAIDVAALKHG